jgi:NADPH-dependent glutamate synthase beta subunit-like oxidoreductase
MKRFKHINAETLEQAESILKENTGKAKVVAGGTDLIGEMKDNILPVYPQIVVNLKSVPGLDFIRDEGQKVVIGALTRLEDIANSEIIKQKQPMLASAAGGTASPHIREMGTLAGNISQANRCWYYWVAENRFDCMRKGGKNCYALTGDGRYHSIFGGVRVIDTPCARQCPDNIEIPDYMNKIREGDIAAAAQILMRHNPLPAMTGRVCPHTCEMECNRHETDDAVSIRAVERYIGDFVIKHSESMYLSPAIQINQKIAVLGSGPAGLSAAYYLRRMGYAVTILENMEQAGGLLTYGIPPYRLPKDTVQKQVKVLADMGIQFSLNAKVGTAIQVDSLMREYAAVFAACGAWKERPAGMKGEEYMLSGSQFLRKANIGQHDIPGHKVAVIGGGNVAIDVARTLLRLGSEPVIVYRRGKAEMPALKDEVQKTEEERIAIQFLTLPVEVFKQGNKIALKCQKMELGAVDASGRPRPIAIQGSDFVVEYDAVMTAIGEEPDTSFIPSELLGEQGRLKCDESTYNVGKNLFAGGDFVTGPSTVVAAIAAGRKAAAAIHRYLKGAQAKNDEKDACDCQNMAEKFNSQFLKPSPRNGIAELPVEARIKNLNIEEAGGLELSSVKDEANRCLNCSCVAVNPSDTAPALIVLKAKIVTTRRVIDAEQFFATAINRSTILDEDEIVTEISIPSAPSGAKSVFTKFALRKSIDFPVVNIAASIECDQGVVKSARICLNSVYNQPLRVTAAEQMLLGKTIDESLAENASQSGLSSAFPLVNNQYKIKIAKTLVKRAILACKG